MAKNVQCPICQNKIGYVRSDGTQKIGVKTVLIKEGLFKVVCPKCKSEILPPKYEKKESLDRYLHA